MNSHAGHVSITDYKTLLVKVRMDLCDIDIRTNFHANRSAVSKSKWGRLECVVMHTQKSDFICIFSIISLYFTNERFLKKLVFFSLQCVIKKGNATGLICYVTYRPGAALW